MKLLYLTTWDFKNEESDGVCKKINDQINVFRQRGLTVDFIYVKDHDVIYEVDGVAKSVGKVGNIKKTAAYIKMFSAIKHAQYDWVYNRFGLFDTFYYRVLKRLKKNGARLILELPSYPYEEHKNMGFLYWAIYKWDKCYISRIKNVVERIVTYSSDDEIFGIKTFRSGNGIDLSKYQVAEGEYKPGKLSIMGVALFQAYHGYERIINGLKKYYENGNSDYDIRITLIGEGPEKENYVSLVNKLNLNDRVSILPGMSREELDAVYDENDMTLATFGAYKVDYFDKLSSLKTRESLAKGLPIITGAQIDVLNEDYPYVCEFPNDDSTIDFKVITDFFEKVKGLGTKKENAKVIRSFAEKNVSMEAVMKPVIDYMEKD